MVRGHDNSFISTARHSRLNASLNRHKNRHTSPKKHALPYLSSPHRASKDSFFRWMPQPGTGEYKPHSPHLRSAPGSTSTTTGATHLAIGVCYQRSAAGKYLPNAGRLLSLIHTKSTPASAGGVSLLSSAFATTNKYIFTLMLAHSAGIEAFSAARQTHEAARRRLMVAPEGSIIGVELGPIRRGRLQCG